jgi:lysyl endopeptidase
MKNHSNGFFFRLVISLFFFCCFPKGVLHAQISEGGLPPSFQFSTELRSAEQPIQIPVNFSVEDLKVVDAWQVSQGAPLAIAKLIPTDLGITNAGKWLTLPNGQEVWQLHLKAKGAIALLLYYSDFYIPEGGKLFIYNIDKSQVLGAYTKRSHPENGHFATELVAGDEILLEYVPAPSGEEPSIQLSSIGYGYNHLYVTSVAKSGEEELSGPCMVNINCEEGENWQLQKKGVCHMVMPIGDAAYICSGSLVNNTAKDLKPYVLSAFHCSEREEGDKEASDQELKQWIFVFHWEYVGCDNSSPVSKYKTMVGCTRKSVIPFSEGSDGLLLLLNENIPADYDVFFNGWDRTNTPSPSGVGIHHPSGDYMKISTYGKYMAESIRWNNSDNNQTGAHNAHWNVIFDETPNGHGVTEGGSSGSPLFNSNGLIIGTLSGGSSSCSIPDGLNLYGKLFFHWNKFGNKDSQRMDVWLDPLNTGVTSLGGIDQNGQNVEVGPKAPEEFTAKKSTTGEVLLTWKTPLYKQVIGWGNQSIVYQLGFGGKPFYGGQKWDTNDLKPIDRKTITTIHFTPIANASYAVYIKQGNRIYEEDLTDLIPIRLNSVNLKKPFVVNANEELLVTIHVKNYDKKEFPISTDEGPAIKGKGNILSMDGKTWETLPTEELDANFVISFTVTSENGELTNSTSLLSAQPQIMKPIENIKMAVKKSELTSLAQDGFLITEFPELTGYQIYRNQTKLATLPASTTQYTDKEVATNSPIYQVTSLYNDKESAPATAQVETNVANEQIAMETEVNIRPSLFNEQVNILNHQQVKLLEIFSANGKLLRKIQHPESSVNTGSLPQGVYFFRLTTDGATKTVQGIKK